MTKEEIIKLFNPANESNVTTEQMRSLTDEQIGWLADAYPNTPTGGAYLILHDNRLPDDRQLKPLSTWQNLHTLRVKNSQKNLSAMGFRKNIFKARKPFVGRTIISKRNPIPPRVVDISSEEAMREIQEAAKLIHAKREERRKEIKKETVAPEVAPEVITEVVSESVPVEKKKRGRPKKVN